MIKLKIIETNEYEYKMIDEKGKKYSKTIEFHDITDKPKVGDYLIASAELFNEKYAGYSTMYAFGSLDNPCGRKNLSLDNIDIIRVLTEDKEIILKRLYG